MRFLMYFSFLLLLLTGCRKNNVSNILAQADEIVIVDPDSALDILLKIPNVDKLSGEAAADYRRLLSMANYYIKRDTTDLVNILYSIDYYEKHNMPNKLIESYLLAASIYLWNNMFDPARKYLTKSLHLAENLKKNNQIAYIHKRLGDIDFYTDKQNDAYDHYKKSLIYKPNNYLVYHAIGSLHIDSAEFYKKESIKLALQAYDTISAKNYFEYYFFSDYKIKHVAEMRAYIDNEKIQSILGEDIIHYYVLLGEMYLSIGKIDSAEYFIENVEHSLSEISDKKLDYFEISIRNGFDNLRTLIHYIKYGKVDIMSKPIHDNSIISSLWEKEHTIHLQQQETLILKRDNLTLNFKRQKDRLSFLFVITCFLLISLIIYMKWRMLLTKKRRELAESEEKAEALKHMLKDISTSDQQNKSVNKILLQQLGFIRQIANSPTAQNQELLKRIVNFSDDEISTESLLAWDDLYPIIDSVYNGFFTKLINEYGNILIDKEIQLCCLLCDGFTTKEISILIGQSSQTIYQRKTTIRKKINMEEKEDIIPFLKAKFNP